MARGTSLELRCGTCRPDSTFPASGRGRGPLLGELYISLNQEWMSWSGQYRRGDEREQNRLPGPRRMRAQGPGTTWRPIPREGLRHVCPFCAHHVVLSEAQLWRLVKAIPPEATVLYLGAVPRGTEAESRRGSAAG